MRKKFETTEISGCVIPNADGHVLLIHRIIKPVQWELPGGKIEPGETPQITAVREAKRGLGVDVELVDEIEPARFSRGRTVYVAHRFVARIVGDQIPFVRELDRHDEAKYKNLGRLAAAAEGFSPNVELLTHDVVNGKYDFGKYLVQ